MSINNTGVDMACANLITPEIACKYKLLPVCIKDNKLMLAMSNPNDIIAIDDIEIMTGYEVQPVVVPDKELNAVLEQFVNMCKNVESQFDEAEEEIASTTEEDTVNEKPAVLLVNQIINHAVKARASDIHIEPQEKYTRVRFRIDGVLHEIMQQPLKLHPLIASRVKVMGGMDIAERRIPQDGRII